MRILVTADYQMMSLAAAELIVKAVRGKADVVLGLPTGRTPLGMYDALVEIYRKQDLDFSRVRTFNLDEYLGLPPNDRNSFRAYMRRHFFDHVNIPPQNVHIPDQADNYYEQAICEAGGIDLLVVGIAANGHIAFNEPGSSFSSRTRVVDLAAETIENAAKQFAKDAVPTQAVTMGIGTIVESRHILLLASGKAKADIVRRALRGPITESVPASILQTHPNVIAILDEEANLYV
jgi:glucosamine-6-phosphate deaminase